MKRNSVIFLALIFLIGLIQCSKDSKGPIESNDPPNQSIRELTPAENKLAQSANLFSYKLFQETISSKPDENLFISPLSVSLALGMAYNGAAGNTREAIKNTLELSGLTDQEINETYKSLIEYLTNLDPEVIFQIANSIWYRQNFPVKTEFFNLNKNYFDAEVAGLNFNRPDAVKIINNWVSEKTHGKITQIVGPQIDPLTMLFLINAIYFKGTWQYEFDPALTYDGTFFTSDSITSDCKMMYQENMFSCLVNDDFQAINLPYGDSIFTMTIFLPNRQININDFINQLTDEDLQLWLGSFEERPVKLSLPKFKLECEMSLKGILSSLGMDIAFTEFADFTNIADAPLFISGVKHKTFVEVNEEGTEAAAVTAITFSTSINPNEIYMTIDRPFVFLIRENQSNTILFMGKIIEPVL